MKRTVLLCLFFLMNIFVFSQELNFAIGEWEPYTGKEMKNFGITTKIVDAACREVGFTTTYDFFPWYRAEKMVLGKNYFATFPYKILPERVKKGYIFSDPIFSSTFAMAYNIENSKLTNFKYQKIEDLKEYRIGIIFGIDGIKLPLLNAGIKAQEINGTAKNITKLLRDRIDFYIDDKIVIIHSLQNSFTPEQTEKIALYDKPFGQENKFRLMVAKDYPNAKELIEKFNTALHIIKENGTYDKLLKEYDYTKSK